jgi:hypothetical protein
MGQLGEPVQPSGTSIGLSAVPPTAARGNAGRESWAQEERRAEKELGARRRVEARFGALIARLDADDSTTQDRSHA